jgi:type VI secretion system protein ImpF
MHASTHSLYDRLSKRSRRHTVHDAIARDLVELLNCALRGARIKASEHAPIAQSVVNYGCPPLLVADTSRIDPARVSVHMREAMRRFEPRLDSARTRITLKTELGFRARPHTLYFDIAAALRNGERNLGVTLALDYLDCHFSLANF